MASMRNSRTGTAARQLSPTMCHAILPLPLTCVIQPSSGASDQTSLHVFASIAWRRSVSLRLVGEPVSVLLTFPCRASRSCRLVSPAVRGAQFMSADAVAEAAPTTLAPNRIVATHRTAIGLALPMTLAHMSTPLLGFADATVIGRLGQAHLLGAIAAAAVIFDFVFWAVGFLRLSTAGLN